VRLSVPDRRILRLAVPALGALAIDPLLTLIDTSFVARVGVTELAALGVDAAILSFAFFGFNFLAYATTPLVGHALGRGDPPGARRIVGDALILAVGIGALASLTLILLAPLFVELMGASDAATGPAIDYLRIRALATPAVLVVTTGHGAFRGHQDTRTPLVVAAGVNAINLVLDPILIFVLDWGLQGAAIATVVAQLIGAIWFLRLLRRRKMAARPTGMRSSLPTLLDLGKSGSLITARTALLLLAFTVAASRAARLGDAEIAAYQVVFQVWILSIMLTDAFAIAGQALIAESAGRRDHEGTNQTSRRLLGWGLATGIGLAALFLLASPAMRWLVADDATGALVTEAGRVAGAWMPIAAPVFIADGIFLGLLAFGTLVASTGAGAIVTIGLVLATPLGDTLTGIWWALGAMMVARGIVFVWVYPRAVAVRS